MTSAVAERSLHLAGVYDDASSAWRNFYPDDLPDDWRLAYYAHYWQNLLIPAGAWERFTADTEWVTEVPDTLRLYFEIPASPAPTTEVLIHLASVLGPQLGGVLIGDGLGPPTEPRLRERWFLPVPVPAVAGVVEARAFAAAKSMVLLLRPEPGLALPQWRALLEQVHGGATGSEEVLVFLHVGPQELEAAETILRLAGLHGVTQ